MLYVFGIYIFGKYSEAYEMQLRDADPPVHLTPRKASDQLCSIILSMDSASAKNYLKKYWEKITYEDRSVLLSVHQFDANEFNTS